MLSSYPLFAHEKGCFQRLKVRVLLEPTRFKERKGSGGEGWEAGDVPLGLRNFQPIPDPTFFPSLGSLVPVPTEQDRGEEREPGNEVATYLPITLSQRKVGHIRFLWAYARTV